MRKDFAKKNIRRKRRTSVKSLSQDAGQMKWRWIVLIAFFTIIFSVSCVFVYQAKKGKDHLIVPYLAHLNTWINERKNQFQKMNINQEKLKAKSKPNMKVSHLEPQIHFEFYSALPETPLSNHEMNSVNASLELAKSPEMKKPLGDKKNTILTKNEEPRKTQSSLPMQLAHSTKIVDAEELEREFGKTIEQNTYIIQLGTSFKKIESAKHYREKLYALGYKADVLQTHVGNKQLFLVELGPFMSHSKALHIHDALQKQGIKGFIQKKS